MKDQLVDAGRARAASLGWPDAYAMTKALGEKALGENRGDIPVSIVRPAIIESAWAEPVPGWIRGFRMAEPVIISYARGLLKEFPGVPEGTVDVIPVDLVVGAICAVAARGPGQRGRLARHHPGRPPARPTRCKYERLVELVQDWFRRAPALRQRGPAHQRRRVGLHRPRRRPAPARALRGPARRGPSGPSTPSRSGARRPRWSSQLEEKREMAERALTYVELYGAYTACEAIYGVDHLLALHDAARRRRPARLRPRPAGRSTGRPLRPRDPPAVGGEAGPGPHRRGEGRRRDRGPPACAGRSSRPTARWPRSTSRTRSSRRTW